MLLCIKFCHLHWICWPVHRHPSRPCKQYGTCYIEVCAVRKRFWSQLWGHHTREKRDRSDLLFETYWLWFSSWNLLTSIHSSNLADFTFRFLQLFGMYSSTGSLVWKRYIHGLRAFTGHNKFNMPIVLQRSTLHYPHPAQCLVLGRHQVILAKWFLSKFPLSSKWRFRTRPFIRAMFSGL